MAFTITLGQLPAGHVLESAKSGEIVPVQYREFLTSEDGDLLTSRLEGFPSDLLGLIHPNVIKPSAVDHMLALIRRDKLATVYLNELEIVAEVKVKRPIAAGAAVFEEDIADVFALRFPGIEVPDDVGVVFVFSRGWRRALYYDFGPLSPLLQEKRPYDLATQLGSCWTYLSFQHVLRVTPDEWERLLRAGWFLFIGLPIRHRRLVLDAIRSGHDPDDLIPAVSADLKARLPTLLESWMANSLASDHVAFIQTAAEHYQRGDNVSCSCILYPRIEGVLRSFFRRLDSVRKPTTRRLIECAASEHDSGGISLLIPKFFRRYLQEVCFASFDPENPKTASRHSVAHGVVRADHMDLKAATVAFLTIEQLFYLAPKSMPGI